LYNSEYNFVIDKIRAHWHKKQTGIVFCLCIYGERNNGKITAKYFFYRYFSLSFI